MRHSRDKPQRYGYLPNEHPRKRPGGNVTGFMDFEYAMSGKWLELLKEVAPSVTRAAVIRDPAIPSGIGQFAAIQSVAPQLGMNVTVQRG